MTYEKFLTKELVGIARRKCGLAASCSTCMYSVSTWQTDGAPTDAGFEARCIITDREEGGQACR